MSLNLMIGETCIASIEDSDKLEVTSKTTDNFNIWTLYLKRNSTLYFINGNAKWRVRLNPDSDAYNDFKYGDKCLIEVAR